MPKGDRRLKRIARLAEHQLSIQYEEPQDVGAMGYCPRVMCQVCLPVDRTPGAEYKRVSGPHHLSILTPEAIGIPYGVYPRGVLHWLATEVRNTFKSDDGTRTVYLGRNLMDFMSKVSGGRAISGGREGNIRRFKRQLSSLLASRIFYWSESKTDMAFAGIEIASQGHLFWNPKLQDQPGLLQSSIQLGQVFWDDCVKHSVPVDMRALQCLWGSCLKMDIYTWLTFRANGLLEHKQNKLLIRWEQLQSQFGPQYRDPYKFRQNFRAGLAGVRKVYDGFSGADWEGKGIEFRFTRSSVLPKAVAIPAAVAPASSLPTRVFEIDPTAREVRPGIYQCGTMNGESGGYFVDSQGGYRGMPGLEPPRRR
jgi:hypothetical protein